MNRKALGLSAIVLIVVGAGLFFTRGPSAPKKVASAYLTEATANEIKEAIKAQDASVVLVNFWASWCEPCKLEFPMILELREKYAARGLKVLFVTIDDPAEYPAAEAFLKSQKFQASSFAKGAQSLQFVADIFPAWHGAVPMTLLFGPNNQLLDSWEGDASLKEFESRVLPHLRGT